jgi:hypothetical protein
MWRHYNVILENSDNITTGAWRFINKIEIKKICPVSYIKILQEWNAIFGGLLNSTFLAIIGRVKVYKWAPEG